MRPNRKGGLLHEIIEGRMRGKLTRGGRIQMLNDLANDGGSDALKQAWKHTERTAKTCCTAGDY